ncbi:o-succinylbenzoate--CoA ligase [Fodinibius salsisoli]|uniref:O-succinylbenzoate--CoA ligase n=1 Tax=Fodinibius salsisoli TaxID=2820877 RepID=A0ABT3PMK0_9BACT|nr:o-succinylbenzoate--CoA ligase [Fodinibius salsisoli]MCW9707181.1 o-succinylbenzoate--CoA ligase [Fodinibius salsisoli]
MNSEQTIPTFNDPLPIDLFLESEDNAYLYDDLRQFEHYLLNYLADAGHDYDSPLALWAQSSDELVFLIAACWRLGIPFVPLDPQLTDAEFIKRVQQLKVATVITDKKSAPDSSIHAIDIQDLDLTNVIQPDFEPLDWVKERRKSVQPDQIFGYFFTSGTSGKPKTVPLKRRQLLFAARASIQNIKPNRNRFWLLCLPLHHVGGISVILRSVLYGAGVFRMDRFDEDIISGYLANDHRFEAASLVPTMLKRILAKPEVKIHDDFQAILLGGGPIDTSMVEECFERGVPIIASYGMTESGAQIAANPLMTIGDLSRPKKSVGKLFSPNKVEIRNADNEPLEAETSGQIWLKGPQIFDGYLEQGLNQAFDNEGWFNTGDFGYLNKNQELFIEARRTDLIISGGENIPPQEVEEALRGLQSIQEAAVIGVPDKEWGQKVVAIVVLHGDSAFNAADIQDQLRPSLRSFKIPKEIIPTDHLPRTKTGKISRHKIKELYPKLSRQ